MSGPDPGGELERRLRKLGAADPGVVTPVEAIRARAQRRSRHRQRVRAVSAAGAGLAVVVAGLLLFPDDQATLVTDATTVTTERPATSTTTVTPDGGPRLDTPVGPPSPDGGAQLPSAVPPPAELPPTDQGIEPGSSIPSADRTPGASTPPDVDRRPDPIPTTTTTPGPPPGPTIPPTTPTPPTTTTTVPVDLATEARRTFGGDYAGVHHGIVYVKVRDGEPRPTTFHGAQLVPVQWSLAELEAASRDYHARIGPDLLAQGVTTVDSSISIPENAVIVVISTTQPDGRSRAEAALAGGPFLLR
jgi:hypothetical protein